MRQLYRRSFRNKNFVFRFSRSSPAPRPVPDLVIERYSDVGDLPESVRVQLVERFGQRAIDGDFNELQHEAVYVVATVDGVPVATMLYRHGRHFRRWFVPLRQDDLVFFRVRTHPECRGQGICPFVYRFIIGHDLAETCDAYVDCRVYNSPSIRSIEKAGFVAIGAMRPITRNDALHVEN